MTRKAIITLNNTELSRKQFNPYQEVKKINTDYKNMTESERNELAAYTAGMVAYSKELSEHLTKAIPYLLALLTLNLCIETIILVALIMN